MEEFPDRRWWSLAGFEIEMITLAYALALDVTNRSRPDSLWLQIEIPFVLRQDDQETSVSPEVPESVQPILSLLRKPLRSLTAFRSGRLALEFENGLVLEVGKHERYESWNTHGTGTLASASMLCSAHDVTPWGGKP